MTKSKPKVWQDCHEESPKYWMTFMQALMRRLKGFESHSHPLSKGYDVHKISGF